MSDEEILRARIAELEEQISSLKHTLGAFALGLDKVSQTQSNQIDTIEGLVKANESQAQFLKRLVENTEKHNELLKRLLEAKGS